MNCTNTEYRLLITDHRIPSCPRSVSASGHCGFELSIESIGHRNFEQRTSVFSIQRLVKRKLATRNFLTVPAVYPLAVQAISNLLSPVLNYKPLYWQVMFFIIGDKCKLILNGNSCNEKIRGANSYSILSQVCI